MARPAFFALDIDIASCVSIGSTIGTLEPAAEWSSAELEEKDRDFLFELTPGNRNSPSRWSQELASFAASAIGAPLADDREANSLRSIPR